MANRLGALIFLIIGIWQLNSVDGDSPVWFWWLWIGTCVYGLIFPYSGNGNRDDSSDWDTIEDSYCDSDYDGDCGDD